MPANATNGVSSMSSIAHAAPPEAVFIREFAREAAGRGWPVFPLHTITRTGRCSCGKDCGRNAGKHPRTLNGLNDATTDLARVDPWWERWADANIGMATGKRAGVFTVDIDRDHGGYATADALQERYGAFPATLAVKTGGGGLQLYYRWPERGVIRNSAGKLGPGVDVRGEGGYTILPPSLHLSGNPYEWSGLDDATEVAAAPDWLLSLLVEMPAPVAAARPTPERTIDTDGAPIPDGQRNSTLTRKAGILRRYGFTEAEILAALERMNDDRCRSPLPGSEVARIAKSVARYAPEPAPATIVRLASGAVLRAVGGRRGR
jgi:hypothetical protein